VKIPKVIIPTLASIFGGIKRFAFKGKVPKCPSFKEKSNLPPLKNAPFL